MIYNVELIPQINYCACIQMGNAKYAEKVWYARQHKRRPGWSQTGLRRGYSKQFSSSMLSILYGPMEKISPIYSIFPQSFFPISCQASMSLEVMHSTTMEAERAQK
jgi:hypothetical protein